MQNSRICINEVAPDQVVVDFHNAAWELVKRNQPYGFAFQKTIEHLGLEPEMDESEGFSRLYLHGTTESVKGHIPDLHRHIGLIARFGAGLSQEYVPVRKGHIGRILGTLTQSNLLEVPDSATLMRTAGVIAYPFVDAVSSDMTEVYYARKPYWFGQNEAAKHADGTPMHRYEARDIGGFVIGWDGLRVREDVMTNIEIDPAISQEFHLLASAHGRRFSDEVRNALRQFLNSPEKPLVEHRPLKAVDEEGYETPVLISFPRTDLKELVENYTVLENDVDFNDIMRAAIADVLTKAAEDPELVAEMEQIRQEYYS